MPTNVESAIIDELYENPQTGDRIVFSLMSASLRYERTLIRKGNCIEYEEKDSVLTIEQFRNLIIERLDQILAVRLTARD